MNSSQAFTRCMLYEFYTELIIEGEKLPYYANWEQTNFNINSIFVFEYSRSKEEKRS